MMKINVSLFVAALLITATATAQHVNIGIKGGLNLYNIKNSNSSQYDSKAGFHLGLLGHIHLSKQLAFQPEILYSAEGAKYSVLNTKHILHLNYVNVPLLLQYMFDNGFRLEAGPQFGFLAAAKDEANGTKADLKNYYKKVDFAVGLGLGYVDPSSGLGIDARYNIGLGNINENSSVKSMNRGFQLGLFYLFNHS